GAGGLGGDPDHADVRPVGVLRRRRAAGLLPDAPQGPRPLGAAVTGRPGPGAGLDRHQPPPPLRRPWLDRGAQRRARWTGTRAQGAAAWARKAVAAGGSRRVTPGRPFDRTAPAFGARAISPAGSC